MAPAVSFEEEARGLVFQRQGEIIPLHNPSEGRGLFANVLLHDNEVFVTYQIAPFDSLMKDKNLYYRVYNREAKELKGQTLAIDVTDENSMWGGDLGDQKFTIIDDVLYMVSLVMGTEKVRLMKFDLDFNALENEVQIGDGATEQFADMGMANDGEFIYTQFFYQGIGATSPDEWGAKMYKLDKRLNVVDSAVVFPETGSFVTGTSLTYVPKGQMGAQQNRFQIFSTNLDYGNTSRVGIHTFAIDANTLKLIPGSTQTIIERDLDVYFPTGVSWNEKHQLWVVGYTQEIAEGVHTNENSGELQEVGPSFITLFDANWVELETIQLNDGENAFRVMLQTEGDDIYAVYDEMDKNGLVRTSIAKMEHYKIAEQVVSSTN
ncbi:hypothetical protein HY733_02610 [Candidatus Uhrbacteria bacterium]|nr:hypothetical protein [Candidatus Uhrbacteria bacterium]